MRIEKSELIVGGKAQAKEPTLVANMFNLQEWVNAFTAMVSQTVVDGVLSGLRIAPNAATEDTQRDGWLTSAQVAKHLGVKPKEVRELASSGELPGRKLRNGSSKSRWRFLKADVDKHMKKRPREYRRKGVSIYE